MSILVKSGNRQLIVSGKDAKLKYTEGIIRLSLPVIDFDNKANYNQNLTFTFTITDTRGWIIALRSSPSSISNNLQITNDGNVYTLTGNRWKFLREHLATLYLETIDDMDQDVEIDISVTDGESNIVTGLIKFRGISVINRTYNNNDPFAEEDMVEDNQYQEGVNYPLNGINGSLVQLKDDTNGNQTGKMYRVKYTPSDPSAVNDYIIERSSKSDVPDLNYVFPHLSARIDELGVYGFQSYIPNSNATWNLAFIPVLEDDSNILTVTLTLGDVNFGELLNDELVDQGAGVYSLNGLRNEINDVLTNLRYQVNADYTNTTVIIFNLFNDTIGTDLGTTNIDLYGIDGFGSGFLFKSSDLAQTWELQHRFSPIDVSSGDKFGEEISLGFNYGNVDNLEDPDFNISVHGTSGRKFHLNDDGCNPKAWINGGYADTKLKPSVSTDQVGNITVEGQYWEDRVKITDSGQIIYVTGFDTDVGDLFGFKVKLSTDGQLLFVTAPNDTSVSKGTVYVFKRNENTFNVDLDITCGVEIDEEQSVSWDQLSSFNTANLADLTRIGTEIICIDFIGDKTKCQLPIMGEYVLVSSEEEDDSGAVYVFKRDNDTWTQQSKIVSNAPSKSEFFGSGLDATVFRHSLTNEILEIWLGIGAPYANLAAEIDVSPEKVLSVSGDHISVNHILQNTIVDGTGDYSLPFTFTYSQEVISGNQFAPYKQEDDYTYNMEGIGFVDAININQTNTISEDRHRWFFDVDGSGTPQIADQDGPDTGKVYRVTFSPRTGDSEQYKIFAVDTDGNIITYNSTVSIEGDQTSINNILSKSGGAAFHVDVGPDWDQDFIIDYKQEVISGVPGTPYIQETGEFNFITSGEVQYLKLNDFEYDEDRVKQFTPVAITDTRHIGNPPLLYTTSFRLSDPSAGVLNYGVFDSVDTYTLIDTYENTNTALNELTFSPAGDYKSNFEIFYSQYRQQQKGDPTWSLNSLSTHVEDLQINFTINNIDNDDGYTVNVGPYDWTQHSNTKLDNFATITDSRSDGDFADVVYRVYVVLDSPASNTNGELRTFGNGGTSNWDSVNSEIVIDGTKSQVQSHLNSIEWWSRESTTSAFTMNTTLWRGTSANPEGTLIKTVNNIQMNSGILLPSPTNTNISRVYDEDAITSFSDETKAT